MIHAISVKDLHVSYFGSEAVRSVSFSIEQGCIVGIIGPNGAGKSTMIKALLGLIPMDRGTIELLGQPAKGSRKKVAYVPQRSDIDWNFPITVLETVLIGTFPSLGLFKRPRRKDKEWAYECLQKVGMESYESRQIGELSGGQQQRVFLARALAQRADLFLLDEPFVGIDIASEETIINLLRELRNHGKTIVVVHHDLSKASAYFDQLLLMNKELIKVGTVEQVLSADVMSKAYHHPFSLIDRIGVSV